MKLYREVRNVNDSNLLQSDLLVRLAKWNDLTSCHCTKINVWSYPSPDLKKALESTYHVKGGKAIRRESEVKDLGVWLQTGLTFEKQINSLDQSKEEPGHDNETFPIIPKN
jgi:hypothetical protein